MVNEKTLSPANNNQEGVAVWLTGLSGAGKTTIARELHKQWRLQDPATLLIDGDEVRTGNAMILNPYGEILAETWAAADKMIVADLEAEHMRMNIGMRWIQSRRPDLYESLAKPTGREMDTRTVRFKGIEEGS